MELNVKRMVDKWINSHKPKLINGKVWVPDALGGYRNLPENDPSYREIYFWIDSQRFVEMLTWLDERKKAREQGRPEKN